jgi:prophage regulatory protein
MSGTASSPSNRGAPSGVPTSFLRMSMVIRQTGLGRSTIYRLMAEQRFPRAVRLAGRAVGWRAADVQQWADSRIQADT